MTGASGFIGSLVTRTLDRHGVAWTALGRTRPQNAAHFISCDLLLAGKDLRAVLGPLETSHLLHLAWYVEQNEYWESELNLRWVDATVRLIEAFCQEGGRRVVCAGTCAEYDRSRGYLQEFTTPLHADSLYGICKNVTRQLVEAVCVRYKVESAWGRLFWTVGPGEDRRRLIPALTDVFQGRREPFGINADAYHDLLHWSDLGEAFKVLLESDIKGPVNLCSGKPTRLAEVVKAIASVFEKDPDRVLKLDPSRPDDPKMLIGDNSRLRACGWRQEVDPLVEIIKQTKEESIHGS